MRTLRTRWSTACLALLGTLSLHAQTVARPKITAISHVGYFVSNLDAARQFWHGLLGFDEMYTLNKPGTDQVRIAFIKINDHQHVELFTDPPANPPDHMSHICFTVSDIEQMKAYLRAQGFTIKSPAGAKVRTGDYAFEIKDPEGMLVEFVQSSPDGWETKAAGKFAPATRLSTSIFHAGFTVHHLDQTMDFYKRILGFTETWRGSSDNKTLSWINMKLPDSDDYVEFMLGANTDAKSQGVKNHLSLAVPSMDKAAAELKTRAAAIGYTLPIDIHTGVNRKRQINLYDPDGTRVELMEPFTVDGHPAPSSYAQPPSS